MKKPTVAETLNYIQKHRIPYGPDKRARYVETVCEILEESRMGYSSGPDAVRLHQHEGDEEGFSFLDLIEYIADRPVAAFDGEKLVELTPAEVIRMIMTKPECSIAIVRPPNRPPEPAAPT
jgi:hypothetical protein